MKAVLEFFRQFVLKLSVKCGVWANVDVVVHILRVWMSIITHECIVVGRSVIKWSNEEYHSGVHFVFAKKKYLWSWTFLKKQLEM